MTQAAGGHAMNGIPPHMMPGQFMQGGMGGMHPVSLGVYGVF